MSLVSESESPVLCCDTMNVMSAEKFSKAWSECRMVLSGVVQGLVSLVVPLLMFLLLGGASVFVSLCTWLIEIAWAAAAEAGEEEDPITVLKIIGPGIARCLFPPCLLFEDPVLQALPRVVNIWEFFFSEFL